jgi:hypothetical protein
MFIHNLKSGCLRVSNIFQINTRTESENVPRQPHNSFVIWYILLLIPASEHISLIYRRKISYDSSIAFVYVQIRI